MVTPFVDGVVADKKLAENLNKWAASGLQGYVVLGSTGESVYLTQEEKLAIIKTAQACVSRDRQLIVGTGCESTAATVAFTQKAASLGAEAALVVTPHYFKAQMQGAALLKHYQTVASESEIPIILYNVPKFTGIDLPTGVVRELAVHPNIIGIKDSTDRISKITELIRFSSVDFKVLIGNYNMLLPGLFMGAAGAVLALANLAPRQCVEIFNGVLHKEYEPARQCFVKLTAVARTVLSTYGIAGIKTALDLLGYFGGAPRPPLLSLAPDEQEIVRRILAETGLIQI